jgi:hypothetical protein
MEKHVDAAGRVEAHKAEGNLRFRKSEFEMAAASYSRALGALDQGRLLAVLHLNQAACLLKLSLPLRAL